MGLGRVGESRGEMEGRGARWGRRERGVGREEWGLGRVGESRGEIDGRGARWGEKRRRSGEGGGGVGPKLNVILCLPDNAISPPASQ